MKGGEDVQDVLCYGEGHESDVGQVPVHVPRLVFLFEGCGAMKGTDRLILTILDCEGDGELFSRKGLRPCFQDLGAALTQGRHCEQIRLWRLRASLRVRSWRDLLHSSSPQQIGIITLCSKTLAVLHRSGS